MTGSSSNPAYRIETERLLIRCWEPNDAHKRRDALDVSDAHLRPWIPWMRDEPRNLIETANWLRQERAKFDGDKNYSYGVFSLDETQLIGETGLYPRAGKDAREIGYWINRAHDGKGYATEAAAAMVRVGFEVDKVRRLEIWCSESNPGSSAIAAKLGFTHEATLRDRYEDSEGQLRESMIWSLFEDAYENSPAREFPVAAYNCIGEKLL